MSRAYKQILLDEVSRKYVTINTHKGLYRPTRVPFGVASASAIFQSKIEQVLQGIPMVVCRVDEILVSGKNDQDRSFNNLNEVLTRLKQAGLRLKMEKCKFMKPSVEYLGYRVDMHGLHAIEKKVEAIKNTPAPENQQQLRSFLGMVNYYAKFVSNYSTVVHPLNELLRHNVKWRWTKKRKRRVLRTVKNKLSAAPVLTHFCTDKDDAKVYIGVTANTFKERFRNQTKSIKNERHGNETELSKYIWKLKHAERSYDIKWSIVKRVPSCKAGSRKCNLCLEEKLSIMKGNKASNLLNKRSNFSLYVNI